MDWIVGLLTHPKKVASPIGLTRTPIKLDGLEALTKQRNLADCMKRWEWMFLGKETCRTYEVVKFGVCKVGSN